MIFETSALVESTSSFHCAWCKFIWQVAAQVWFVDRHRFHRSKSRDREDVSGTISWGPLFWCCNCNCNFVINLPRMSLTEKHLSFFCHLLSGRRWHMYTFFTYPASLRLAVMQPKLRHPKHLLRDTHFFNQDITQLILACPASYVAVGCQIWRPHFRVSFDWEESYSDVPLWISTAQLFKSWCRRNLIKVPLENGILMKFGGSNLSVNRLMQFREAGIVDT